MATSGEKADEASGRKGKMKLLLFGGPALVVLLGGGAGAAWFTGLFGGGAASESPHEAATGDGHGAEDGHGDAEARPAVVFVDIPDLIVNLQSESPQAALSQAAPVARGRGGAAAEGVGQLMPRVMDSFQLYLRALSLEDVQGAAGMQRLKEELAARVNLAVAPARVAAVLLKEMLVQ